MKNDRCAINFKIFLLDILSCKGALTLQITLRNEIPGNNGLLKVTSTKLQVWLPNSKKNQYQKLM